MVQVYGRRANEVVVRDRFYTVTGERDERDVPGSTKLMPGITFKVEGDRAGTILIGVDRYGICPIFRSSATAVTLRRLSRTLKREMRSPISLGAIDDGEALLQESVPYGTIFTAALEQKIGQAERVSARSLRRAERRELLIELGALRRIQQTLQPVC